MLNFNLPIMIGCYDKADKCSVIAKGEKFGGYDLYICRLKERMEVGEYVPKENIGKVICHIHFCKLDALKQFAKGVNTLVELWEDENENGN